MFVVSGVYNLFFSALTLQQEDTQSGLPKMLRTPDAGMFIIFRGSVWFCVWGVGKVFGCVRVWSSLLLSNQHANQATLCNVGSLASFIAARGRIDW